MARSGAGRDGIAYTFSSGNAPIGRVVASAFVESGRQTPTELQTQSLNLVACNFDKDLVKVLTGEPLFDIGRSP